MVTVTAADDLWEYFGDVPGVPASIDWDLIEAELGSPLPSDYREFCERYPSVRVNEKFVIMHPVCLSREGDLLFRVPRILDTFRDMRSVGRDSFPLPIFPERGGVLPWGFDEDQGFYFWKTVGDPDGWTVGVNYRHRSCRHDLNFSAFITGILGGGVECENVPRGFADFGVSAEKVE
ncbi:hypothetical protein [Crossiella sp. CA198]|uniref:hypothetical protein n=1 Tax=Crossiella sp. CA198 TaxID=3455607 RepID=UPI003F8D1FB7